MIPIEITASTIRRFTDQVNSQLRPQTMNKPENADWHTFTHKFENPHGPKDWITDREKLLRKLLPLSEKLNEHPETYRAISRSLMKYAHNLDTLVKGSGLFESAMSGTGIPFCFVPRCDMIRDELVKLSRLLTDSTDQREYVCMAAECLCVQLRRLSLCPYGGGDFAAEAQDGMVDQARAGILGRWTEQRWDVMSMWKRFWGVWVRLDSAVEECGCYQCVRRMGA